MTNRLALGLLAGIGLAAIALQDGRRGAVVERTPERVTVHLDSYGAFCSGPHPVREVQVGEGWETLEERPWSGVVLDGERLPYAMCCIVQCQPVERGVVDLLRYDPAGTDTAYGAPMRVYESAPVEGPIRATFHLYADPACAVPREVAVTIWP